MAGDWIKMRCDLATDPAVITIAERLGLDEDAVVGKLHRFWSWCSLQLRDGNADVTLMYVDRYVGVPGFAEMMCRVGWIDVVDDKSFCIPNFDRHMSKSAKTRALTAERVKRSRNAECNADVTVIALPEKRRSKTPKVPTSSTPSSTSFDQFWSAYPKRVGKAEAEREWRKINPTAELLATILAAIERQRNETQWRKGFIPNPSTWLHNHRWDDEPESAAPYRRGDTAQVPDKNGFVF